MKIRSLLFIFLLIISIVKLAHAQTEEAIQRAAQGKVVK